MKTSDSRRLWARILTGLGSLGMLLGAIDPMEGSLLILPGSLLMALGTLLGRGERRLIVYRTGVFILVAVGVGALWGLSWVGGFGGKSGLSMWWGLLILPYLIGWSMGVWGPGTPRWALLLGIGVGLWYLTLFVMVLKSLGRHPGSLLPVTIIAALGLLTIGGCLFRLWKGRSREATG
jgi:hypothetical protein